MDRKANRVRFFVKTTAPCSAPSLGSLLDAYLNESLSETRPLAVRSHLRRCIACAAYVHNAKAIDLATRPEKRTSPANRSSGHQRRKLPPIG